MEIAAFPEKGVSLKFLHLLSTSLQETTSLKDITTRDMNDFLAHTTVPAPSIADLLSHHKRHSKRAHPIVSSSTVFLCHRWDYRFSDLIDSLCRHYPQSQWQSTFIWIDVFCLSSQQLHHPIEASVLQNGLSKIGNYVIVIASTKQGQQLHCISKRMSSTPIDISFSIVRGILRNAFNALKNVVNYVRDFFKHRLVE